MEDKSPSVIKVLTEHANEIVSGSYKNVDEIFSLTNSENNSPEISELAEAFGMMSVKVEAREFALEQTIKELKEKNERIEYLNKIRSQLSSIFISVVLFVSFYIFIYGIISDDFISKQPFAIFINDFPIFEIILLVVVIRIIVNSRLPIKDFGITLNGWRKTVVKSVIISAIFIGVLSLFKYYMNIYYPGVFKEKEIFNFSYFGISYITYLIIAPLQEFIVRGTVQSSLQRLFDGKYKGFLAIAVTTFLFGALHMCDSLNLAVASFITSWLWGWMFLRQKNLIGVGLSHFLIGNAAGLMGFWNFF